MGKKAQKSLKKNAQAKRERSRTTSASAKETKPAKDVVIESNGTETSSVPPKGLPNLGNTCFFNSVTQCILQTQTINYYLDEIGQVKELVIPKDCIVNVNDVNVEVKAGKIPLPETNMPFNRTFSNFITEFKCGRSPNPKPVFDRIASKVPRFRGWNQQDSHELLRYFLDGLRQEEIDRFKDAIEKYLEKEKVPEKEIPLLKKAILKCVGVPLLDAIFGGTLLQTIKCSECTHVSTTFEPFLDLSLPLARSDIKRQTAPVTLSKHQQKKAKKAKKKKGKQNQDESEDVKDEEVEVGTEAGVEPVPENSENPAKDESNDSGLKSESDNDISESNDVNGNGIESLTEENDDLHVDKNNDCVSLLVDENENEEEEIGVIGALKRFISIDVLCASDAYECEKCCAPVNKARNNKNGKRKTVKSFKRYMIFSPPPILTLHLKRFEQTHHLNRTSSHKIGGHIDFPMELDLGPFCAKSEERVRPNQTKILYSLYGIVCHSGNLSGGHYIAYVRSRKELPHVQNFFHQAAKESFSDPHRLGDLLLHKQLKKELNGSLNSIQTPNEVDVDKSREQLQQSSRWYYCSDSNISMVTEAKVKFCEAYLLFYERVF